MVAFSATLQKTKSEQIFESFLFFEKQFQKRPDLDDLAF